MSYASGFLEKYQWQCKQEQNIDMNDALHLCYSYLGMCVAQVFHKFQKS